MDECGTNIYSYLITSVLCTDIIITINVVNSPEVLGSVDDSLTADIKSSANSSHRISAISYHEEKDCTLLQGIFNLAR